MANTYTSLHYHLIFSTKTRTPWLTSEIEARVWAYIGGVARHHKMIALQVGGHDDHIHALLGAPAEHSPTHARLPQYLSKASVFVEMDTRRVIPDLRGFAVAGHYGTYLPVSKSESRHAVIG